MGAFWLVPSVGLAGGRSAPTRGQLAEQELQLAAADEATGLFARAREHYRTCIDRAPGSRAARTARLRVIWIEQRGEGGFVPLATLARVRRDPGALANPSALARLAAQTESFPGGLVRSELRLRIGEAWLKLDGHRGDGVAELQTVVDDPTSGAADRRLAETDLAQALHADGRIHRAGTVKGRLAEHLPRGAPVAAAVLALGGAVGLFARRRSRVRPGDAGVK